MLTVIEGDDSLAAVGDAEHQFSSASWVDEVDYGLRINSAENDALLVGLVRDMIGRVGAAYQLLPCFRSRRGRRSSTV
jgi:hypothetical protein